MFGCIISGRVMEMLRPTTLTFTCGETCSSLLKYKQICMDTICFPLLNFILLCFRLLQDLFGSGNKIHDLSCLPNVIPKIEVLDLTDNEISDWDEMVSMQ